MYFLLEEFGPGLMWILLISPIYQTVKHILHTVISCILSYLSKTILSDETGLVKMDYTSNWVTC